MIDLYETRRLLIRIYDSRPTGCASRFKLMDAADAVSKAIEAMDREARAPTPPLNGEAA